MTIIHKDITEYTIHNLNSHWHFKWQGYEKGDCNSWNMGLPLHFNGTPTAIQVLNFLLYSWSALSFLTGNSAIHVEQMEVNNINVDLHLDFLSEETRM